MKIIWTIIVLPLFLSACQGGSSDSSGDSGDNISQTGSEARFVVMDDQLYTISAQDMTVYGVSDARFPVLDYRAKLPFTPDALFTEGNYLIAVSGSGVYLFDISVPSEPSLIMRYTGIHACKGFAIQGSKVFVALNHQSSCVDQYDPYDSNYRVESDDSLQINKVQIFDVSDLENPVELNSISVFDPTALAVKDDRLFVCDGEAGMKVYDVSDAAGISRVASQVDIQCDDLILVSASDNETLLRAVMLESEKIKQFSFDSATNSFELQSQISTTK